ncbi:MAG: hypothetical protein ACFFE8_05480 [Candidatus Heimdallarchaeota archaeon]
MTTSEMDVTWNYLDTGHCAFKTGATSPNFKRCNHLFTVTGKHGFIDCPLIQPKFFAFQQQEGLVYLIEKNQQAGPSEMWGFSELPDDRDKARKIVAKKIKNLPPLLQTAILKRFEQYYEVANIIRTSEELRTDEDEDSLD